LWWIEVNGRKDVCLELIFTLWQRELLHVFSMFYLVIGGCGCTSVVMPPSALDRLSMYLWSAFPKFCPRCEHIIIYLIVPTAVHSEDDDYVTHRLEKTQHLFCYVTRFGGDSLWDHIHTFHCQDSSSFKILSESLQLGFTWLDIWVQVSISSFQKSVMLSNFATYCC
jgi:hypothetical protein